MRYILLLLLTFLLSEAIDVDDTTLKKQIGRMIVFGFDDTYIDKNSSIIQQINRYDLGGVILFDRFYKDKNHTKNISSPTQLKELTSALKKFSHKPLLISLDQEGGKVARLKPKYGFDTIPSANSISKMVPNKVKKIYKQEAKMLHQAGINTNFAPVVDLAINPKNKVIVGLERSYGGTSKEVSKYAKILIDAQRDENIISVLKHFPGHGSSLGFPSRFCRYHKNMEPKRVRTIQNPHRFK